MKIKLALAAIMSCQLMTYALENPTQPTSMQQVEEINSQQISGEIEKANEAMLEQYAAKAQLDNPSQVITLPPFATLGDVKVAVSKLIMQMGALNTKVDEAFANQEEKLKAIDDIDVKINAVIVEVEKLKEVVLSTDMTTKEGKATMAGLESRLFELEQRGKDLLVKKIKIKKKPIKIKAAAIKIPNGVIKCDKGPVNIRIAPYKCATAITSVNNGEEVYITSKKTAEWVYIKTTQNKRGWINKTFLMSK